MKIKGAIFDMDGTLVDSMFMWYDLGNIYVKKRGKEPKPELAAILSRMSMMEAALYLIEIYGFEETPEELIRDIYRLMEEFYQQEVEEKPEIRRVLDDLKAANIPMCVASATDAYMIEYALKRVGIRDYFQSIFCCRQVGEGKHSDKIYQVAREDLGSSVEETLVFEDALHAAKTAKTAGFPVVSIFDESEPEQEQMKELGDLYLESYKQWPGIRNFSCEKNTNQI